MAGSGAGGERRMTGTSRAAAGSVGGRDGRTLKQIEFREQRLRRREKVGHVFPGERCGLREFDFERITVNAADAELVVEMRPGGEAGAPDVTDGLALPDTLPRTDSLGESGEVRVQRSVDRAVLHDDGTTVSALASREDDLPIAGGFYCGAPRSRVINPPVCADLVQNRMAPAEVEA